MTNSPMLTALLPALDVSVMPDLVDAGRLELARPRADGLDPLQAGRDLADVVGQVDDDRRRGRARTPPAARRSAAGARSRRSGASGLPRALRRSWGSS